MAELRVLNPVARSMEQRIEPAPRPSDLNGKRIGLYWNIKDGGDIALRRTQELLQERYPKADFGMHQGDVGFQMRYLTPAGADRLASECDVVVGTASD